MKNFLPLLIIGLLTITNIADALPGAPLPAQRGPARDNLGDEIARFNLPQRQNAGMAWDGELIWCTSRAAPCLLFALDPSRNYQVVHNYQLNQGDAIGLGYDPVQDRLWVNFYVSPNNPPSIAYQYNRQGELVGQVRTPRGGHNDFAFNGDLVYCNSENDQNQPCIYIINRDGQVIDQGPDIRAVINHGRAISFEYVEAHDEGPFWVMSVGYISQMTIDFENNQARVIREFRSNNTDYPHQGLTHDGYNLIAGGTWAGTLGFVYDDGFQETYGEAELSREMIEFGPTSRGREGAQVLRVFNRAQEEDELHVLSWSLTDQGGEPRWLRFEPQEGQINARSFADITFTAITEGLDFGEYERTVLFECNDPGHREIEIPIHIFVVDGFGQLTGTVTRAANNQPVEGALVRVDYFGFESVTDANGHYEFPDIPAWTYDLVVTKEDYLPFWAREREIRAGQNVQLDIALLHAEFALNPARIDRSMPPNEILEVPLTLRNNGNGPLAWGMQKIFHGGADIPPWQFRAEVAAGDSARDTRMGAVEFVNGMFYTAGGNSGAQNNYFYVFDRVGNLRARYDQPAQSAYGMRDLCYDGALLWGADGNNIYGVDLEGRVQDQFPAILRPTRNIAWDPVHELLWTANVTTAIVGVNRDGQEIRRVARPGDARINGMAWWPEDPDGFNLYLFTANGDLQKQVWKVNVDNGQFRILRDLPEVQGARSGGLCISGSWDPYSWVFMSMLDSPDHIGIWQLAPRTGWLDAGPTEGVVEAGQSTEIAVTFDANGLVPEVEYTADLSFTHDGVGGSFVAPIVLLVTAEGGMSRRDLDFANGWNMVSLNVTLPNPDIRTVMRPLVEQNLLLLMKDGTGRFYNPAFDFCNIPGWNSAEGYQVKVDGACELSVEGEVVPWDTPIALRVGWQLISYYPRPAVNAITAFQNIVDDLAIVKDGAGHFYLPDWGFNNIGNCVEGQGYQVKMDAARELVYSLGEGVASFSPTTNQPSHFIPVAATGRNMSVLLISDFGFMISEFEIGAFTSSGICVGSASSLSSGLFTQSEIRNHKSEIGLAVWGDDPTTEAIDGLREGETFFLKMTDRSKKEWMLEVESVLEGPGLVYETDGFTTLKVSAAAPVVQEYALYEPFPNPFNAQTKIRLELPEESFIKLMAVDLNGRIVKEFLNQRMPMGQHRMVWSASNLPTGTYLLHLEAGSKTITKKALILK